MPEERTVLDLVSRIRLGGHGVSEVEIGGGRPIALIAGPCALEDEERAARICAGLQEAAAGAGVPFVFKSSFDKANRTSFDGYRGPGIDDGLAILRRIRERFAVPITTDVHEPGQAALVSEVADLLQIPAFLCRQTDLLAACAATGKPVNLKKGQFLAPWDVGPAVAKLTAGGAAGVMVTERGATFGYNNLVADMRALPLVRGLGVPVCFDATHSVQLPGGEGLRSGGQRELAPYLARAAAAAGVDALFVEVHDDPDHAPSDAAVMMRLDDMRPMLAVVAAIDRIVRN